MFHFQQSGRLRFMKFSLALILLQLFTFCAAGKNRNVTIGIVSAFDPADPASMIWGIPAVVASLLIVDIINSSPTLLPSTTIIPVINSTSTFDSNKAIVLPFYQAHKKGAVAIIGDTISYNTILHSATGNYFNVPIVSGAGFQAVLDNKQFHPLFFRISCSSVLIVHWFLKYIKALGYARFGVMTSTDLIMLEYMEQLKLQAPNFNMQVSTVSIMSVGAMDATLNAQSLKSSKNRVFVMLTGTVADAATFARAAVKVGLYGPGYVFLDVFYYFPYVLMTPSGEFDPTLVAFYQGVVTIANSGSILKSAFEDQFLARLANFSLTSPMIRTMLEPFQGKISAPSIPFFWNIDSTLSVAFALHQTIEVMGADPSKLQGSDLLVQNLRNLNVTGYGTLEELYFGPGQFRTWRYSDLIQYKGRSTNVVGKWYWALAKIEFQSGDKMTSLWFPDNKLPPEVDPIVMVSIGQAGMVASIVVACIGCVICSIIVVIVEQNKTKFVFKSAAPRFLQLLLFGCILGFAGLAFIGMDLGNVTQSVSDASCHIYQWLLSVGFTIVFASLIAKTYRISQIFNSRSLSVVKVTDNQLFLLVAAMVSIEVVINSVWSIKYPLQTATVLIDDSTTMSQCSSENFATLFATSVTYKGIICFVGCYFSFKIRNVPSQFSEAKQIVFCSYNLFFISAVILPVSVGLKDPIICHAARICGIGFGGLGTVLIMFFNSLYMVFFDKRKLNLNFDASSVKSSVSKLEAVNTKLSKVDQLTNLVDEILSRTDAILNENGDFKTDEQIPALKEMLTNAKLNRDIATGKANMTNAAI